MVRWLGGCAPNGINSAISHTLHRSTAQAASGITDFTCTT